MGSSIAEHIGGTCAQRRSLSGAAAMGEVPDLQAPVTTAGFVVGFSGRTDRGGEIRGLERTLMPMPDG